MPKRAEKLPRYYQRREDNGLLRVRVQVPAPLFGRVLNERGETVRNLIYEFRTGSLREAQQIERRHDIINGFHRRIEAVRPVLRLVDADHGQMVETKRTVMVMRRPGESLDLLPGALASRLVSRKGAEYIVHDMPVEPAPIRPAILVAEYPSVIDHWAKQQSIGDKGKDRMTLAMKRLAVHCGHSDMNMIGRDPTNIVRFKRALFAGEIDGKPKDAKTVSNYVKDIRTLFGFAKANQDITIPDPFEVQKKITFVAKRNGKTTRLDFRPEQRQQILAGALASDDPVIKWVNIVLLYSGMRLAELAEAYTQDIWHFGSIPALHIDHEHRAENETLKTDESERYVPLHPSIVKLGFLRYVEWVVETYGHGPLFPMLTGKRASQATQRIRKWFRFELGITDARRAPTHSHRHSVETIMMERGVRPDVAKRITGHLPEDIAEQNYTHYRVPALYKAIKKIPDPKPPQPGTVNGRKAEAA